MRLLCSILIMALFCNALGATTGLTNYLASDQTASNIEIVDTENTDNIKPCCSSDDEGCEDEDDCCGDNCDCQCCQISIIPALKVTDSSEEEVIRVLDTPSSKTNFYYQSKRGFSHVDGLFQPPQA